MRGQKRKSPGSSIEGVGPPSDRGFPAAAAHPLPSNRTTKPFANPREQHLPRYDDSSSSELQQDDQALYRHRLPVSSRDGAYLDGPGAHSGPSIHHAQRIPESSAYSSPNSQRALPSRVSSQAHDRDVRQVASPFQPHYSQRLAAGGSYTGASDDERYDANDHRGYSSLAQRRGDAAHFKASKLHIDVAGSSTATEADESRSFSEYDRDHRSQRGQYHPQYHQTAHDATPRAYRDAGPDSAEAIAAENSFTNSNTRSAPATRSSFGGPIPHQGSDARSSSHSFDSGRGVPFASSSHAGRTMSPSLVSSSHGPPGGLSRSHGQGVTLPPPLQEGDHHPLLPPLALFQQDGRKAPLTGLSGPSIPRDSPSPPAANRTRTDTDGPLQQPLPPPGRPSATGIFATPAAAVPSSRDYSMHTAQMRGAPASAAAGGPPSYRPAMQRPYASAIDPAAGPAPASAPANTARLPEHLRTPTRSKTQFLGLFSDFYDSLQDSRALRATLEDQIRRSATILETLQQGYKTMGRVMTEERGKWETRIERLEEQVNVLEGRQASKSQLESSPRNAEESLQAVDGDHGTHATVASSEPTFVDAEVPSSAKGKGRPRASGGGGAAISRPSTGKEVDVRSPGIHRPEAASRAKEPHQALDGDANEGDELPDGERSDGDRNDMEEVGTRSLDADQNSQAK
ncbi:unnamed protein product [Jaminaea pallidilutea]